MKTIEIAKDFSTYPAGRSRQDGPHSGERFRKEFLEDALGSGEEVCVILDGTRSYGSSFLEEAFGGLVRKAGFTGEFLNDHLKIVARSDQYKTYAKLARKYINEATAAH